MSNIVLAFPNYTDSTFIASGYNGVTFAGGSWNSSFPLSNLAQESLKVDYSRSTDANNSSTLGYIDFGTSRSVRLISFPDNNISRSGTVRIRLSNTAKFSNMQVNALTGSGSSSIVFHNVGSTSQTITTGDFFTISGDGTSNIYTAGTTATIAAGATASISISPNLVNSAAANTVIICRTGDFTSPVLDTGDEDVWKEVYPFGSLAYGSPSFWDGKINSEDAYGLNFPYIHLEDSSLTARYMLFEVKDSSNTDGYIRLGRLFVSQGWQATVNMLYGSSIGWLSNTQSEKTIGGSDVYERRAAQRVMAFEFDYLPEDEVYSNVYEMQRQLDISKQLFVIYNPEDTANLQRRAFLATMTTLNPIKHPQLDRAAVAYEVKEVIA